MCVIVISKNKAKGRFSEHLKVTMKTKVENQGTELWNLKSYSCLMQGRLKFNDKYSTSVGFKTDWPGCTESFNMVLSQRSHRHPSAY